MKNTIIVLERSELNYLIKYDSSRISTDRIINFSYNEFKQLSEKQKISLLQNSLPIYEQEHEVLLIEYDSKLIGYDNGPILEFKGIFSIIPLTETGARLLSSKLNTNFKFSAPLDSKLYKSYFNYQNHILRHKAGIKICSIYEVPEPDEEFIADFKIATLFQLNTSKPSGNDSTLAHLIDFNVTPSFIPEGNIEAVLKSACVGMKKLNKDVDQITRSTFYSFVTKEKSVINSKTLFEAINYIVEKIESKKEAKSKFKDLTRTLSENGKYGNAFLLFTYFYFLKKEIEKSDYDISAPKNDILELKYHDSMTASKVLFMLGYTFSMQTISKSIQSFSTSALLKTRKNLDLEWAPRIIEKEIIEISKQEKLESNPEDEKAYGIKLSAENKSNEEMPTYESKRKDTSEAINPGIGLFSEQKEAESKLVFNFQEFKNNIKKKSFLTKIVKTLNDKGVEESKITKQLLITCLKEIGEYKTQKGGLRINAKEALIIFE